MAVVDGGFKNHGRPPLDSDGEPPDDGRMEERVKRLEAIADKTSERLAAIDKDIAVIKSNYATKSDVSEASNKIIMWVVGAIFLVQLLPIVRDMIKSSPTQIPASVAQPSSQSN